MKRWLALNIALGLILGTPGSQAWATVRISLQSSKAAPVGTFNITPLSVSGPLGMPSLTAPSLAHGLPVLPQTVLPMESPVAVNAADAPVNAASSASSITPAPMKSLLKRSPKANPSSREEKPDTAMATAQTLEENIVALDSQQEGPAEAGDVKDILDAVFDGGLEASNLTSAEAVSAAMTPKRSGFGRLLPAIGATAAIGVGVKAISAMPASVLMEAGSAQATGVIEALGWSPTLALTAAVAIPFVTVLVPTFIKSFFNRRSRQTAKLAKAVVAHADKKWETPLYTFYTKTVKRKRKETYFLDRVTVKVPQRSPVGGKRFGYFGRIEILSQRGIPQENGRWHIDSYKYDYKGNGDPISGMKEVHNARRIGGKVEREGLEAKYYGKGTPLARGMLARWAPNESGKGWALLAGAVASLPAFFMAGTTSHPVELFLWTASGLIAGFLGEWWRSRYPKTAFRIKNGEKIVYYGGLGAGVVAYLAISIPAGVSAMIGFAASVVLARAVLPGAVSWIKSPLKPSLQRRGAGFSKFKFALIALFLATSMAGVYNPSPVSAGDRAVMAERMSTGTVGSEYAEFMKAHPDVDVYFVAPWHKEDMSKAIGRHYDKVPGIQNPKIMLNAESYGVRSVDDWESMELALSTLVHEFDHDRTEEKNDGAPTTLEHEHSAWDHQARFIIEQFKNNPDLFKPGHNDQRKSLLLKRAQRWLKGGPEKYRDYVSGNYEKNKALSEIKTSKKAQLEAFYSAHRDEMQEAWLASHEEPQTLTDINNAISALTQAGHASQGETIQPTDASIYGRFLMSLFSLLAVFGLGRMIGPRNSKK